MNFTYEVDCIVRIVCYHCKRGISREPNLKNLIEYRRAGGASATTNLQMTHQTSYLEKAGVSPYSNKGGG